MRQCEEYISAGEIGPDQGSDTLKNSDELEAPSHKNLSYKLRVNALVDLTTSGLSRFFWL